MTEAQADPIQQTEAPATPGKPKTITETFHNVDSPEGDATTIEHQNEPSTVAEYVASPYIATDRETGLPLLPFPLQAVADIAQRLYEADLNDEALAKSLKVTPEQVKAWREEGTDPKRLFVHIKDYLGKPMLPVPLGLLVEPNSEGRMRMVACEVDPDDGRVVWSIDWNHGELLFRRIESKFHPLDTRVQEWQKNYDENVKGGFTRGVASLKGTWAKKPVVLVGNSPSLAQNGHLLAEIQRYRKEGKVLVVGCNRAFKYHPPEFFDYYFCTDFQGRRDWFEGHDCNKTKAIAWLYATRLLREHFRDENIIWHVSPLCNPGLPDEEKHRDLGWTMEGASVATDMLHFAFYTLQANPIIMIGFDFSYPGLGGTLMRYPDEPLLWGQMPALTFTQAQTWDGKDQLRVEATSRIQLGQSRQINWGCMWVRRGGRRVINCTEGGIQRNPDRMPFREAIDRYIAGNEDPLSDPRHQELRRLEALAMNVGQQQGAQT